MSDRGCFGLPSVFSLQSDTCSSCSARTACSEKSYALLLRVRGSVDVERYIQDLRLEFAGLGEQRARASLTLAQLTTVESMPARLRGRLKRLLLDRFDVVARQSLEQGENPFPESGSKVMHLAGEMLLAGGMTKIGFRNACQNQLGWSYGTAATESSVALALLRGLGLTKEKGSAIRAA